MLTQLNELQTKTQNFAVMLIDINTRVATDTLNFIGRFPAPVANFETDTYLRNMISGIEAMGDYAKKAVKFDFSPFTGYKK